MIQFLNCKNLSQGFVFRQVWEDGAEELLFKGSLIPAALPAFSPVTPSFAVQTLISLMCFGFSLMSALVHVNQPIKTVAGGA